MKLLEKGNYKPRAWSMEIECTGIGARNDHAACHSILEVNSADIVSRKSDLFGVGDSIIYGVKCIECGCFTRISDKHIPYELKKLQNVPNIQRESER